MFSFFAKGPEPLQLYGKLPIAKDYLRIGAAEGAGLALRDWMDRAFSPSAGAANAPSLVGALAFALGDSAAPPLLGILQPSSDTGGLRPFPFALFVEHRRKALLQDLESGAGQSLALWRELERAVAEHSQHRDAQSFLTEMRGRSLDIERIAPARAEAIDFAAWRNALNAAPDKDFLSELLATLRGLGRQAYDGPIRLPLVHGMPSVAQTQAWWIALRECALVRRDAPPTVFLPAPSVAAGSMAAFAVFFRKPPTPEQAPWLRAPESNQALAAGDLSPARVCTAPAQPAPEQAPPLADSLRALLLSQRA